MSKSGTIVGLTGTVWARGADGSLRQLAVGDELAANETLILAAGATISVNYSPGSGTDVHAGTEVVTYTAPDDGSYTVVAPNREGTQAAPPELVRIMTENLSGEEGSGQSSPQPGRVGDGYRFVEVVRVEENLETDAIAPLTLRRVEEVVRPMSIDWGDPVEEEIAWPDSSGQGEERPTNRAPEAAPETRVIKEDEIATGNVLQNDIDPENSPLSVTQYVVGGQVYQAGQTATIAGVGTLLIGADGTYTFTPVADWNGTVPTATYTLSDGRGGIATSTLDITVEPVADITPDEMITHAGDPVTVNVLANDTFEHGDAKVTAVTQGAHGTVVINPDGTITYTPAEGFVGADSYTYTVTSGGVTETTTVTVDVTNTPPVAAPEAEVTPEDTPLSGNVLANESDADADPLTVTQFMVGGQVYQAGQTATLAGVGTLVIHADGNYNFTPAENWNGTVPTVTYTVSDGNQGGITTSTLDIRVTPVNDAPLAGGLPGQTDADADVISGLDIKAGFSDVEGDTLTYSATGLPLGLTLDPETGLISGTIDSSASQSGTAGNPAGVYTVVVTADDGHGGTVSQSFTWTVTNPAPEAVDDTNTTDEHTPLTVDAANGVLGNDSDPDGETLVVSAVNGVAAGVGAQVTGTSGGTFTLNADGSYDFDPNGQFDDLAAGETRTTSITYTVSDGEGGTDTATLEVTVTGVNDAPVAVGTLPGQSNEDADAVVSVDIRSAFADADASDTLTYSATGLPLGLTLDPTTGLISGTIDNSASQSGTAGNPAGVYTVVVTADDGHGGTVSQSFTWTVTNPAPEAKADQGSIMEDGPDLVVLAANGVLTSNAAPAGADVDPDGDVLAVTHVVAGTATGLADFPGSPNAGTQIVGQYGTLTLNADGSYTYVLDNANSTVNALDAASAPLSDTFSYAISDGEGGTSFTTLTITINGNDDGVPAIAAGDGNGIEPGQITVHESGLTLDGPGGETAVASGTITVSAGNGLASVTIGGTTLTLAQLEALTVGSPVEIDTPQGKLTLTGYVSSGQIGGVSTGGQISYTYTLEQTVTNPEPGSNHILETVSLSVEDAAGGTSTSSLGINIVDDAPSSNAPTSVTVNEANLAGGTNPDTGALTQTGSLNIRTGADNASVSTVFNAAQTAPEGLTSNGVQVVYVVSGDGQSLTATAGPGGSVVFTVTLTNPGTPTAGYSFVLSGPLDHGASNIDLSFAFTVTDADGDTAVNSFQVSVVDDGPVAVDQPDVSLAEGGAVIGSASGGANLLGNDTAGADGSAKVVAITYTNEAGDSATATVPEGGVTVDTQYGSLTVHPDGTWSYTSDQTENNLSGVSESFGYTIADKDGSTSSANQSITVTDTGPSAAPVGLTVDEQNTPGTGSTPSAENAVTQNLAISKGGDAISDVVFTASTVSGLEAQNLTSGGTALVYTLSPEGHTLTATAGPGGPVIFTLTLNNPADGTGESQSVTMTLTGALDHAAAGGENSLSIPVTYTVHDTDSSTTAGLNLTVIDDVPTAQADTGVSVAEGGQTVAGTSLLGNDVQGADGARVHQIRYINEAGEQTIGTVSADPAGSTFDTIHGSLIVRQDGTWSFTSDPVTNTGTSVNHPQPGADLSVDDVFEYNLIDGDGDISGWASQTVTVTDTAPSIGTPTAATLDEASLASGTNPDTEALTKTGSLAVTKGADGIDVTFAGSQAALEALTLTSGGTALVYTVSNGGHTLTATAGAGGPVVFVATITDPTSASAGYSFVLSRPLDHASGNEIQLPIAYGVTDGDGDTDTANVIVTIVDDEPQTDRTLSLDEDSSCITFNTSADASPANLTVSDPANGTATVNPDGTITYVPDAGFSGTDTFTYTTTGDNGNTVETTVTVTVNPVSDAPQLTRDAASVLTNEDEAVALGLNAPVVTDATDQNGADTAGDNPELLSAITLTGIPAGAVLLDALGNELMTATGGPITIQLTDGQHISGLNTDLTITTATYEGLRILPPAESHANFTVTVSVTSHEVDDAGVPLAGVPGATSTTTVTVNVQAVTDPIALDLVDGNDSDGLASDHTIAEDTSFNLTDLLSVSFGSTDGNATTDVDGSEERWFEISGLPIGTTVNGVTVTAENPVVTVQAPGLSTSATGLPAMTITPPPNFSGDVSVTVTLKARDEDADGVGSGATTGAVVQDSVTLNLHITPVGGDVAASDVTTTEDTPVAFLSGIAVTDDGGAGSEVITKVTFEVPAGWTLAEPGAASGYTLSQNGSTYTIEFDSNQTEADREAILDGFTITPPGNSSADHTFNVEVTTADTVMINGGPVTETATTTLPIKVTVTPVAETVGGDSNGDTISDVTMTAGHSYTTAGKEDTWFTLGTEGGFDLKAGWSNQDADEQTFARLTPELTSGDGGANTAIGSQFRYSTNGITTEEGGAWTTVTYTGTPINIPVAYLDTLQFKAPANLSGSFKIKVEAYTVDTDPDTGVTNTKVSGVAELSNLVVDPVADEVTVALNARVTGNEDTAIPLEIRPTSSDPSETFTVTISNIPAGAQLYYNGVLQTVTSGSVTIANFDSTKSLSLQPPLNSNADFTLNVSAYSVDGSSVSGTQNLTVDVSLKGVADVATITPVDATYSEAALDAGSDQVLLKDLLTTSLYDNDGSEVLTLRITGLPEGFSLSQGTMLVSGTGTERVWVLTQQQYDAAVVRVPANFSGTQTFTVTPVTTENDGNSLTGSPQTITVNVTPSPDATVTTSATLSEDALTPLNLGIVHQNGDTDETLTTVWIAVSDAESANFSLYLGATKLAEAGLSPVTIDGQDYYVLTGTQIGQLGAKGASNLDGPLGSFNFKYEIVDAHYGAAPVDPGTATRYDGTFTLTASPITDPVDVKITSISGGSGTTVSDAHPGDDAAPDTASLTAGDTVTVTLNVAKLPDAGSAGGTADTDGSEKVIRIVIEGVPDGVSVQGGEYHGDGTWILIYEGADALPINSTGGINLPVVFEVSEFAANLDNWPITIQVQTRDRGDQASETAIVSDTVTWHLTTNFPAGEGDIPANIVEWAYNGAHASEDTAFTLADVIDAQVAVADPAVTNTFTVSLTDLPPDTIITGMRMTVVNGQEVWTAAVTVPAGGDINAALQNLLASITVTPPANSNENNSAGAFHLDASLTVSVPSGNNEKAVIPDMTVPVDPVTDAGVITISAAPVNEGVDSIPVTIEVSNDADGAFGTIVDGKLYIRVDAAGSTNGLENGTLTHNGSALATEMINGVQYYVVTNVAAGDTIQLVYTPDNSTAGQVSFSALVKTQEANSNEVLTGVASGNAQVIMINNGVTVSSAPSTGNESTAVQISNLVVSLVDQDGSEAIKSILLSNVPNGFLVYVGTSAESAVLASNAGGDNTWVISNPDGSLPAYVAIVPPDHWSGTLDNLTIMVESGEGAFSEGIIQTFELGDVTITPVADGIDLTTTNTFGPENQIIALNLNASMADPADASVPGAIDASQELTTLKLTGLGAFASFYVGATEKISGIIYDAGTDTYTLTGLTQSDLDQLGFLQARDALTDQNSGVAGVQIRAEAFTTDGSSTSASDTAYMTVNASAQLATSGNDQLLWTGSAIDAGAGVDTIHLRKGEVLSGSELDSRLANVEILDLHSNDVTSLSAADVLGITGSGATLTILGGAEDTLTLGAGWTSAGPQDIGGIDYVIYTATVGNTDVQLQVQSGIHID